MEAGGPSSEGDRVGHLVLGDVVSDLGPAPCHHVDQALGAPRQVEARSDPDQTRDGPGRRRLHDHAVARHQGRADLAAGEVERVVEGRDRDDDAERHALDETKLVSLLARERVAGEKLSVHPYALLGSVVKQVGCPERLRLCGLERLRHLVLDHLGDLVRVGPHHVGGLLEELGPLPQGSLGPSLLCFPRSTECFVNLTLGSRLNFINLALVHR
mmetsp:Transcript_38172/g.76370  ORF Transcript_38172/g.76370 Transcript_38172/m.76370 type:complete len:214 (-) Transcript_38172:186-827(-)